MATVRQRIIEAGYTSLRQFLRLGGTGGDTRTIYVSELNVETDVTETAIVLDKTEHDVIIEVRNKQLIVESDADVE